MGAPPTGTSREPQQKKSNRPHALRLRSLASRCVSWCQEEAHHHANRGAIVLHCFPCPKITRWLQTPLTAFFPDTNLENIYKVCVPCQHDLLPLLSLHATVRLSRSGKTFRITEVALTLEHKRLERRMRKDNAGEMSEVVCSLRHISI